jgi:cell division protein FtsQ
MAIDPRIRARRVAVRRAEGRRRLRFLVAAVGLVAVIVAGWGLTRTPLLDLDHVRIDGVAGADADAVAEAAGLTTTTPMLDLDLGAAEARVEALSWVRTATAGREWPGTVRLRVEPRIPVAVLGPDEGARFLVDAEGVLIRSAGDDASLPRVDLAATAAPGEVEADALPGIAVARALPDDLRPWVEAVVLDGTTASDGRAVLGLDLVGSAVVHLGNGDHLDDKLTAVRSLLDGADLTCVDEIDVAVADLATVTRDPDCEAATGSDAGSGDA